MVIKFILWFARWSAEFGAPRNGSPELNVMLAEYIYSESPEVVGVKSKIETFNICFCFYSYFPYLLLVAFSDSSLC